MLICLFVFMYPINVKTAEPIEPNIFEYLTPDKVYD